MAVDVLLGLQWGDEGKGKVVDVFTPRYDIVARFQGGPNAGHTLEFNGEKHVLHLIPSGIFHPDTVCLIGNGVVIDPVTLRKEIEKLEALGVDVRSKLLISRRAHLILPSHRQLDRAEEEAKGEGKIGSTLKGIAPTYRDKIGRGGLRVGDLIVGDFDAKYADITARHGQWLGFFGKELERGEEEKAFLDACEWLRGFKLVDSENYLQIAIQQGKTILAEGAQGTLLDIDFGSYPFVTSSNTITAGACTGLGIAPNQINRVYGIFKAYCTRVGSGPFPTELMGEEGEALRQAGREFGATTGRPRRCGWLDLPALRYAIRINGVTDLIMTKADILSYMDEVKVCTSYQTPEGETDMLPYSLEEVTPILRTFPAWKSDVAGVREPVDLPLELKHYIEWLQATLQTPITYLSVGPDREQILTIEAPSPIY